MLRDCRNSILHNAINTHHKQLPAALEHFGAAMVNVFVLVIAVMGHGSALMAVMKLAVVSSIMI